MDKSATTTETTRATSLRTPLQPSCCNNSRHHSSKSCADKPFKIEDTFKIEDNDENAPNGVCNMHAPISHLQHGQLCDLTKEEASSHPATLLYQNMSLRQLEQTALPRLAETIPFGPAAAVKPISELSSAGYVHVKDCKYSITNGVTGSSFLSKRGITEARKTLGRFCKETKGRVGWPNGLPHNAGTEIGGPKGCGVAEQDEIAIYAIYKSAKHANNLVSAGKNVITNPKILAGILDGFLDLKTTSYQFGDALSVAGESWFNDSVISIGLDWIIKTSELGSLAQIKSPDVTLFTEAQASKCSTAEFVIQSCVSNNFDWKRGKLMVPTLVNGNHWTAGFMDIPAQEILYGDSKNPDASLPKYWRESIFAIMKRMGIYNSVKTINYYPKQKDSYNCGPCTLITLSEADEAGSDSFNMSLQSNQGHIDRPLTPFAKNTACRSYYRMLSLTAGIMYSTAADDGTKFSTSGLAGIAYSTAADNGFDTFDYEVMKIRICNEVNKIGNIDKFYEPDKTKPRPDLTERQIPSKINLLEAQQKAMESLEDKITKMKKRKEYAASKEYPHFLRVTGQLVVGVTEEEDHEDPDGILLSLSGKENVNDCKDTLMDLEGEKCKLTLLHKQKIYKIKDKVKQAIKFNDELNAIKQSEALAVKTLKSEKWLDALLSHHWSKEKSFQTIMDKLATMAKQTRLESKMTEIMNKGRDLSDSDYTLDELVEASSNYWGMIKVAYQNAIANKSHYMCW
ncbi:hypothetical protein HDU78_010018, partial [Chytriomyces hyalinus]